MGIHGCCETGLIPCAKLADPRQVQDARKPEGPGYDVDLDGGSAPAEQDPRQLRLRDTDECQGFRFFQTLAQVSEPKAGIDRDQYGANLEQGKGQGKKIMGGGYHEYGAGPCADPDLPETTGNPVTIVV